MAEAREAAEQTGGADRRRLPAVDVLVRHASLRPGLGGTPRGRLTEAARGVLAEERGRLAAAAREVAEPTASTPADLDALADRVADAVGRGAPFSLRAVVNATGVILHTNLGRAVLGPLARRRLDEVAGAYSTLELALATKTRGSRYAHVEGPLRRLTGAEAALVVNNNAAAVLLALETLARGREVVVSRGELVEIGGEFRIPDIMLRGGAVLREVGTTNRTHLGDYADAIGPDTALLLKVHTSNYRVVGFTADVSSRELVALGRERGIPVMEDLGSGSLVDVRRFGLPYEPTVAEVVGAGVDLVTFSADKLLGGPQAGIAVGRAALVAQLQRNPWNRALRIDKLTLAALEATLYAYEAGTALEEVPTLAALAEPVAGVERRARRLLRALPEDTRRRCQAAVVPGHSEVGGGALPTAELATAIVALGRAAGDASRLDEALRAGSPPVVGRVAGGRLLLDCRTILPAQIGPTAAAVVAAAAVLLPAE